ncbi:MAG: glycosyltransferase [Phycisphaerales bacterium]
MLRVLQVTESITASAGGTSTAFVEIVEALRTQAAEGRASVRAITQDLPAGDEAARWISGHEPGVWTFTGRPGRLAPGGGALAREAVRVLDAGEIDVVHLHGLWLIDLVAIAAQARRRGIPVVWQPHGMLVHAALRHKVWKKRLFRLLSGLSRELASARAAIFTSDTERDTSDLSILGRATRREVVPLPVAIPFAESALPGLIEAGRDRWLKSESADPGRSLYAGAPKPDFTTPLLTFIGRLHPVKRLELAIAALTIVRREVPGTRLLLIGEGDEPYVQSLRDLARREGVLDAIIFAGWLNGQPKWEALAAGDALLIQSEFENFGYAIVESLVAGTPAVMTRNLSLAAAVEDIGAGAAADPDPASLARAVLAILARRDRRDMGHRGRRWVEESFSRQAVGARLLSLYQSLRA